jgi:protein deglycase
MKKVLLLLARGFESFEAAVFIDVIGWNKVEGRGDTELFSCGLTPLVRGSFGFTVKPDYVIDEISAGDFDALAIPGGFEEYGFYEDAYDERFLSLIRRFHEHGRIIASICTGALPIGKSGVLKGRKATTYGLPPSPRQQQLRDLGVDVVDRPIVIDGSIITSWNPSTAVDVALTLLELLTSSRQALHIKKIMGFTGAGR